MLTLFQSAEWQQFQSDLLMTVRVANDFKTEAQHELEKLVLENKTLRDKNRSLESQVEKLKGMYLLLNSKLTCLKDDFSVANNYFVVVVNTRMW